MQHQHDIPGKLWCQNLTDLSGISTVIMFHYPACLVPGRTCQQSPGTNTKLPLFPFFGICIYWNGTLSVCEFHITSHLRCWASGGEAKNSLSHILFCILKWHLAYLNFISLATWCDGLWEEEPQTVLSMSFSFKWLSRSVNFISLVTSCFGLQEEEPQTAHLMSYLGVSYSRQRAHRTLNPYPSIHVLYMDISYSHCMPTGY